MVFIVRRSDLNKEKIGGRKNIMRIITVFSQNLISSHSNKLIFSGFVLFTCIFLISFPTAAEAEEDNSGIIALERVNQAKELSMRAIEHAEKAQEIATSAITAGNEAMSTSKNAAELSDKRFSTVRDLLYIISVFAGGFVVISTILEIQRRKIEQIRFQQFVDRQDCYD